MNIGVDLDGVLTDIQRFNLTHAPQFFLEKFQLKLSDESAYDIRDIFKCTDAQAYAYWKKYLLRYTIAEPARAGAKAALQKLHDEGHSIFIITKRVLADRRDFLGVFMRFLVRCWLRLHGLFYDEIMFCDNNVQDSKKAVCLQKHIDIMVDDDPVNIRIIASIAKVICFDTSYNRDCNGETLFRAYNWGDVYRLIHAALGI